MSDTARIRRDLGRLRTLQRINHAISAEKDLDRLLEIVMDAVIEISGADRGFLILEGEEPGLDGARIVARNMDQEQIRDPASCFSTSIAAQVLHSGRPVLTPHANQDDRFSARRSVRLLRLRSVLCIPLLAGEQVIGAIYLDNDQESRFSEEDAEFLQSFADPAAIALQNAKLDLQLQQRKQELVRSNKQLRGLTETSRAMMVERDVERLLAMIVEQATQITEGERSSLFLVDPARELLVSKIAERAEVREIAVPIGCGIAGQVAQTRRARNIGDAYADPQFDPAVDKQTGYHTRNILAVPLLTHEDEVLGVIEVINKRNGVFSSYDEELLGALAAHAATALDNHRLFGHYLRKQQIEHELQVAHKIQKLLLPGEPPRVDGLQIAAFYKAFEEAGGDYYDFFPLPGSKLAVVVGDVSGHGIGAAMLMATARASLRAYMETVEDLSGVLARLNRGLVQDMELDRFMTLFLCVLDLEQDELTYTNAGHALPLMYRPAEDRFIELADRSLPLGMLKEPTYSQSAPIALAEGDLILLMTDGVWEAADPQDEEFGRERLCELVRRHHELPVAELVDRIYREVALHCLPLAPGDDFTLLGIQRTATGAVVSGLPQTATAESAERLPLA